MHIRSATPEDAAALLAIYAPYVTNTAITFEYEVPSLEDFRSRIAHTLEKYPYLVAVEDAQELGDPIAAKSQLAAGDNRSGATRGDRPGAPGGNRLGIPGGDRPGIPADDFSGVSVGICPGALTDDRQDSTIQAARPSETILGYAYAGEFKKRAAYDWAVETSIYVAPNIRGKGVGGKLHAALKDALVDKGIQNMCACITVVPEGLARDPYITNNSMEFHHHLGYQLVGRFHKVGYKFDRWYDMVWMELMIGDHPVPAPNLR